MTVPNGRRLASAGASGRVGAEEWRAHLDSLGVPVAELPPGPLALVAPHPDDEVLGLGATLAARGGGDVVVCVSDGSASHPGVVDPSEMRARRRAEFAAGARELGLGGAVVHLDLPDGGLSPNSVDAALHPALDAIAPAAVAVTWSGDGHPDHHVCAESVHRWPGTAAVVEFPVWMWHWAEPEDPAVPWDRLRRLPVPPHAVEAKRRALAAHASQLESIAGTPPILPAPVVERFFPGPEWVFAPAAADPGGSAP